MIFSKERKFLLKCLQNLTISIIEPRRRTSNEDKTDSLPAETVGRDLLLSQENFTNDKGHCQCFEGGDPSLPLIYLMVCGFPLLSSAFFEYVTTCALLQGGNALDTGKLLKLVEAHRTRRYIEASDAFQSRIYQIDTLLEYASQTRNPLSECERGALLLARRRVMADYERLYQRETGALSWSVSSLPLSVQYAETILERVIGARSHTHIG